MTTLDVVIMSGHLLIALIDTRFIWWKCNSRRDEINTAKHKLNITALLFSFAFLLSSKLLFGLLLLIVIARFYYLMYIILDNGYAFYIPHDRKIIRCYTRDYEMNYNLIRNANYNFKVVKLGMKYLTDEEIIKKYF
jgi:hypothetical protein